MLSYPSGMTVSKRALIMLTGLLGTNRTHCEPGWRRLAPGRQT